MRVALPKFSALSLLALLISGCATGDYVVLMDNPDGTAGNLTVAVQDKRATVDAPRQGIALTAGGGLKAFSVSQQRIANEFSAALAAQPPLPLRFQLYFDTGGVDLTPASELTMGEIIEAIRLRGPSVVAVIGHTDTLGGPRRNEQLGLIRAQRVADLLRSRQIDVIDLQVSSHGERNLLIPTPNWVSEPRNRRVEISVR